MVEVKNYACDKCHKEFKVFGGTIPTIAYQNSKGEKIPIDLCPICHNEFCEWISKNTVEDIKELIETEVDKKEVKGEYDYAR